MMINRLEGNVRQNKEYVMKHKRLIGTLALIALTVLFGVMPVQAGDPARTGTAAGEQLLVPVGARGFAMGGSDVAFTSGLDALYYNPAGFGKMNRNALGTFSTMQIFNDINVNYLALGVKAGNLGNIAFSLKAFDFGDIPVTTNQDLNGASGATFSPTYITGALTFARQLTDGIAVGLTGKVISESVPRASANAVAFDIGVQYAGLGGINGLALGVAVKNIGTNMSYSGSAFTTRATDDGATASDFRDRPTATHELPSTIQIGLGYAYEVNEENSLSLNGNFENANFGDDQFLLGVEYSYDNLFMLRGGYRMVDNVDPDNQLYTWTMGVGLNYDFGGTNLMFDYGFRDSQYFDGNNLFQLTIGF